MSVDAISQSRVDEIKKQLDHDDLVHTLPHTITNMLQHAEYLRMREITAGHDHADNIALTWRRISVLRRELIDLKATGK